MKNIIPVTDLQRWAAQVLSNLDETEAVVITQRGRASAVLISARRYAQIEKDLRSLDDLELLQMVEEARQEIKESKTVSHTEVKKRLNFKE
ncbi:MAG: type II toxin-antitoxin system prevent-host-death family antitoxin [Acidobacteriota bacterium]|nr:type II toxin-antitoxin system prevent-host-death family antitoxin [Acidobacteriota bacterium]